MQFNKTEMIEQVKQQTRNIRNVELPHLALHHLEFTDMAGITDDYPEFGDFVRKLSYAEKRQLFENSGMKVLHMSMSVMKAAKFVKSNNLNDKFLDGKTNAFLLEVNNGLFDAVWFVVAYTDANDQPLCNYTVNWDIIKRDRERAEATRKLMREMRKKNKPEGTDDLPF